MTIKNGKESKSITKKSLLDRILNKEQINNTKTEKDCNKERIDYFIQNLGFSAKMKKFINDNYNFYLEEFTDSIYNKNDFGKILDYLVGRNKLSRDSIKELQDICIKNNIETDFKEKSIISLQFKKTIDLTDFEVFSEPEDCDGNLVIYFKCSDISKYLPEYNLLFCKLQETIYKNDDKIIIDLLNHTIPVLKFWLGFNDSPSGIDRSLKLSFASWDNKSKKYYYFGDFTDYWDCNFINFHDGEIDDQERIIIDEMSFNLLYDSAYKNYLKTKKNIHIRKLWVQLL